MYETPRHDAVVRRVDLGARVPRQQPRRLRRARTTATRRWCRSRSTGCCSRPSASTSRRRTGRSASPATCSCVALSTCTRRGAPAPGVALLAAGSILLLGPGWQNIIWPLQIGWLVSIACGLGALLDARPARPHRRHRRVRAARCCDRGVRARRRDRRRAARRGGPRARACAPPGSWPCRSRCSRSGGWPTRTPASVRRELDARARVRGRLAAATLAALAGLAGPLIGDDRTTLGWGRPLAVAAVGARAVAAVADRAVPTRVLTLLTILAAFWCLTAAAACRHRDRRSRAATCTSARSSSSRWRSSCSRGVTISRRAWLVVGRRRAR